MPDFSLLRDPSRPVSQSHRVTDVMADRAAKSEPTLSFEFFPPKDEDGAASLWRSYDKLLEVAPDFVSVTYGAGGSNRETSLAVVDRMAKDVLTVGHLTCVGASRDSTREVISRFEAAGVRSILALRGDSPRDNPNALAEGELKTALQLVELVANETSLEVGVAAFPEKHPESPDFAHDAKVLNLKQQAGASYAITQLFFTVDAYVDLVETSKAAGATLPIVPGLMPIGNAERIVRMAQMSGAKLPVELLKKFESADEAQARVIGMDYSIKLATDLIAAGAPGLHIYTLNLAKAAIEVARGAGLCH
jgi:methylenetetrahydrofolate reductase (NADPH)